MNISISRIGSPVLAALVLGVMTGCGGISDLTRERVATSESTVNQAQQSIGNSEAGALELQRAKDNLEQARKAVKDKNDVKAERFAQQARLDAELAMAKAQSSSARKAADELLASIQTLRQEANRNSPPAQ